MQSLGESTLWTPGEGGHDLLGTQGSCCFHFLPLAFHKHGRIFSHAPNSLPASGVRAQYVHQPRHTACLAKSGRSGGPIRRPCVAEGEARWENNDWKPDVNVHNKSSNFLPLIIEVREEATATTTIFSVICQQCYKCSKSESTRKENRKFCPSFAPLLWPRSRPHRW